MTENEIAKIVVDAAFQIHKWMGPGLLESVYETENPQISLINQKKL